MPVVRPKLGHRLGPAMMGHRAGSSDLPVRCRGAVLAGAAGPIVGVEERRNTGPPPGGRSVAPGESEAAARVDRPGRARGVVPDAAERLAPAPDRDSGNAAALAPPHSDQEVDPAPVTGTATARRRTRRADRPPRQRKPGLGRCPHPGRTAPPRTPDRRGHDPQDPARPTDPAADRTRRPVAHISPRPRPVHLGNRPPPRGLRAVPDPAVCGIRDRTPNPPGPPAGRDPVPDRPVAYAAGPGPHRRPRRSRASLHAPDPGPGRKIHQRLRHRVHRGRHRHATHRSPGSPHERHRRAVRTHRPRRMHRPDAHHRRTTSARRPVGILQALQHRPQPPRARHEPARPRRQPEHHPVSSPGRPDPPRSPFSVD